MRSPADWTRRDSGSRIVATAIHAGHDLRAEVRDVLALSDEERAREEDLYTDRLTVIAPSRIVVHRSRFELDVNRPRELAIYRTPEQAWGLDVWRDPPSDGLVNRSLELYDRFYEMLGDMLRSRVRSGRHFVVLDIHSYNYRRAGAEKDPTDAPDLNLGTGSLDKSRWGYIVRDFMQTFRDASGGLDVRENVAFRGGYMSKWIHEHFGTSGCCLALEFKKTFTDEWTGELFEDKLEKLISALAITIEEIDERLAAA